MVLKSTKDKRKGGCVTGRVNKRTPLAEPAQIAFKLTPITSAFLPPASMESKGNEMVGSSEEDLFMISDESLTGVWRAQGKMARGMRRARSQLTADWQNVRAERSAYQRWTGIGGLDERTC